MTDPPQPPPELPPQPLLNTTNLDDQIDNARWSDIVFNADKDCIESVLKIPLSDLGARHIRTLCSRLKIRGVKNARKEVMIDALNDMYKSRNGLVKTTMSDHIQYSPGNEEKRIVKRKRAYSKVDVADAVQEDHMQSELAREKLRCMQKEEERKEKEEARKEIQHYWEEWNHIQSNIRTLRGELKNETDEDIRADLKQDIEGLIKRKDEVAKHLGLK